MLRVQRERMNAAFFPSAREYSRRYGLDARRMALLPDHAIVMHPGPMNRGMEIAADVADSPRSVIVEQVTNGVSVRMAVLYLLLGGAQLGTARRPTPAPTARRPDMTEHTYVIRRARILGGDARRPRPARRRHRRDRRRRRGRAPPARPRSTPTASSLLPGLVDLHTHLREPGREDAETVETGSARPRRWRLHRRVRHGQHRPGRRHRRRRRAGAGGSASEAGLRRRAPGRRRHRRPRRRAARRARRDGRRAPRRCGSSATTASACTTPCSCAARWSTSRPSTASSPSTRRSRASPRTRR